MTANSYEARLAFPRRSMKHAIDAYGKALDQYERAATEALEAAAIALVQVHSRHISGYCAAMGSACFYARYRWFDKKTEVSYPIDVNDGRCEDIPISVQRDIMKFERDLLRPYNENFGHDYVPLRVVAKITKHKGVLFTSLTADRHW